MSSGSRYIFDVWARDSFGNYSVAEEEFVYEPKIEVDVMVT